MRPNSDRTKLLVMTGLAALALILYIVVGLNSRNWQYALSLRVPKLIAIVLTGCAIAVSTVVFQTVTNNRILTPSIMGLDSLYLLIQSLALYVLVPTADRGQPQAELRLSRAGMIAGFAVLLYRLLFRREIMTYCSCS